MAKLDEGIYMKNKIDFYRTGLWNQMHEILTFQKGLNRLLDDFQWFKAAKLGGDLFTPPCDIDETVDSYIMNFDLPGISKEDLKVEVKERELIISGERKNYHKESRNSRHITERFTGAFCRVVALPNSVNTDTVHATLERGVLRIRLLKVEPNKTRLIKIADAGLSEFKNETKIKDFKIA